MSSAVTQKDLRTFADLGARLPVERGGRAGTNELVDGLMHFVESPAARLVVPAARALVELASRRGCSALPTVQMSDAARRRLGYLAEELSTAGDGDVAAQLAKLADALRKPTDSSAEPVTLTAVQSASMVRAFQQRADDINHRWRVYGKAELSAVAANA